MHNFKLLKVFGVVFKVFAWIILIIGLVGTVGLFIKGASPEVPKTQMIISILTQSLVLFLVFYALGEVIKLLLVLEERSRKPEIPGSL